MDLSVTTRGRRSEGLHPGSGPETLPLTNPGGGQQLPSARIHQTGDHPSFPMVEHLVFSAQHPPEKMVEGPGGGANPEFHCKRARSDCDDLEDSDGKVKDRTVGKSSAKVHCSSRPPVEEMSGTSKATETGIKQRPIVSKPISSKPVGGKGSRFDVLSEQMVEESDAIIEGKVLKGKDLLTTSGEPNTPLAAGKTVLRDISNRGKTPRRDQMALKAVDDMEDVCEDSEVLQSLHKDVLNSDMADKEKMRATSGDPQNLIGELFPSIVDLNADVEYYFSDLNLATTDHLMRFIHKDPDGYVPISVVASFKKIKAVISSNSQLAGILGNSSKLVVSEDGKKVKRQYPLTESDMEELQSRIVVAENLPEDHCHQNLMKIFSAVGSVKSIRTCLPQTSGGGASSASRLTKADGMLYSNKLHAFVEYESVELAEKAIAELNDERDWRSGLRVRLMLRRGPKTAQARGKKGHDEEWHYDEEDTSTSEQHLNEKQWEDPSQQPDAPAHEHMGEEHINEKEGGQRKGRNRGRGKGRGRGGDRGQHYHNHRGNHVGTPPSNNPIGSEQAIVGKQPPGPRMPDGTRGFAMGRGKPVAVNIV
ncbi:hypothetical protein JRO89_XS03G0001500 [Xanthoceras sorbifolium]|uniref:Uncharacterized protein n=1 Tax=Xanthoceras sorbifolium TaxID=99658 RepID=A0ABQ8I823_9ROSI|nr:hypothetical protein JRO89_XS03G0001500 [Xanthoceras sorbifolium]